MNRRVTDDGRLYCSNSAGSRYAHSGWEKTADPQCRYCGSEAVDVDLSGSVLMFACTACDNWETTAPGEVMVMHNSGEPYFSDPDGFTLH